MTAAYSETLDKSAEKKNKILKAVKENRFFLYVAVMLVLLFLRNVVNVGIPVWVLLLISVPTAVLGTPSEIVATAVVCIPMYAGFQYKYLLFFCIIGCVIKSIKKPLNLRIMLPVLFMMFWELLHIFMGSFAIMEFFRCFAELMALVAIINMDEELDYKLIFRALSFAVVGVCAIILFIQYKQYVSDVQNFMSGNLFVYRFGEDTTAKTQYGLNFNANGLGMICNFSTMAMIFLISRKENNIFDLIFAAFSVVFTLMTLSRAAVICLLFMIVYYLVFSQGKLKTRIWLLVGFLLIVAVSSVLLYEFFPNVFENLLKRFSEDDISNGRNALFAFYHKHIFSSPLYLLFGVGLQDFANKILRIQGEFTNVCHNGIQEVVSVWGVVGLGLLGWLIYEIIDSSKKYNKKLAPISLVALLLWGLNGMSTQWITSGEGLLTLIVIYVVLTVGRADNE